MCNREVHQRTNRVWFHCADMQPICENGQAIYPKGAADIAGQFCAADDLDGEYEQERKRRQKEASK